jgi:hypothetical protein
MKNNDVELLEKAYLSIKQPVVSVPSDDEAVTVDMQEPADMSLGSEEGELHQDVESCGGDQDFIGQEESEEEDMAIGNLDSIRDSIMKISRFCGSGGHLVVWQQQKLAIAMDNLAEVARRIRL